MNKIEDKSNNPVSAEEVALEQQPALDFSAVWQLCQQAKPAMHKAVLEADLLYWLQDLDPDSFTRKSRWELLAAKLSVIPAERRLSECMRWLNQNYPS